MSATDRDVPQIGLGFQVATNGPLAGRERIGETIMLLERLGYACAIVTDHVAIPYAIRSAQPYSGGGRSTLVPTSDYFEPVATLSFIAGRTRRIRIGTSVLVLPYRNPILTAKMLATIDVLSAGRLFVGVGLGWLAEEFAALQAPPFAQRGPVVDEWLEVFRLLWTEPRASFTGKFYAFRDIGCFPKPLQRPYPPILMGGNGPAAIRRAARSAQGWQPFRLPPHMLRTRLVQLDDELRARGRSLAKFDVSLRYGARVVGPRGDRRRRCAEVPGQVFVGTAAEVAEALRPLIETRPTNLIFDCRTGAWEEVIETITRLAEEVWPRVAAATGARTIDALAAAR
jgi:probable F420-dependent oxidoreductase